MNFWKIFALSLLIAVLLATAHMEYKAHRDQVINPVHYGPHGD
jgi:hypothetical protein